MSRDELFDAQTIEINNGRIAMALWIIDAYISKKIFIPLGFKGCRLPSLSADVRAPPLTQYARNAQ